jgi:hypothetical protein
MKNPDFYKDLEGVLDWVDSAKMSKKQNENDVKQKRE